MTTVLDAAPPATPPSRLPGQPGRLARPDLLTAVLWVAAVVALVVQAWPALTHPWTTPLDDLEVYRVAVGSWSGGGSLYTPRRINGDMFTYPPFAGLVMSPLAGVPREGAVRLWTLGELAAVLAIPLVAGRLLPRTLPRLTRSRTVAALALLLAVSAPTRSTLRFGQISVAIALACVAGWALICPTDRPARPGGGWLIGLAAALKLVPALLPPVLWWCGHRRAAVVCAVGAGAATLLGAVASWQDSLRYWGHDLFDTGRIVHVDGLGNQSLAAVLARLGVSGPPLLLACSAMLVLVGARRARAALRRGDPFTALVVLGALTVLVSPVSWTHHQTWLVLAAALRPVGGRRGTRTAWAWRALVVAVTVAGLPGGSGWPWPLAQARFLLAVAIVCLPLAAAPGRREAGLTARTSDRPGAAHPTERHVRAASRW